MSRAEGENSLGNPPHDRLMTRSFHLIMPSSAVFVATIMKLKKGLLCTFVLLSALVGLGECNWFSWPSDDTSGKLYFAFDRVQMHVIVLSASTVLQYSG